MKYYTIYDKWAILALSNLSKQSVLGKHEKDTEAVSAKIKNCFDFILKMIVSPSHSGKYKKIKVYTSY